MGNKIRIMSSGQNTSSDDIFDEITSFKFHESFPGEFENGLYFNNHYIPEEIVLIILNYVDPQEILNASLVCKKWCNIIKSTSFWILLYNRKHPKQERRPKLLPWYVYYCYFTSNCFDTNLLKNGNGQNKLVDWVIIRNYGDEFRIENPPHGADPLPEDIPDFNGYKSCFATSYYECNKLQEISFKKNKLLQLVFNLYKPHIYVSEWVAGRFDCGCVYTLWCKLCGYKNLNKRSGVCTQSINHFNMEDEIYDEDEDAVHAVRNDDLLKVEEVKFTVEQWQGSKWEKMEMVVKDYPPGVHTIIFQHEGKDTQFWKGHYGSKMAGGVVKILFDTIEP